MSATKTIAENLLQELADAHVARQAAAQFAARRGVARVGELLEEVLGYCFGRGHRLLLCLVLLWDLFLGFLRRQRRGAASVDWWLLLTRFG